jgi:predicted CoA-binding protein
MNVAVVGASNNPERYSHQAVLLLEEKGHTPYPVHPTLDSVAGRAAYKTVREIPAQLGAVTVYLSARNQGALGEEVLSSGARRVIFNPGAENPALAARLREAGVDAVEACTLVLLRTGQF